MRRRVVNPKQMLLMLSYLQSLLRCRVYPEYCIDRVVMKGTKNSYFFIFLFLVHSTVLECEPNTSVLYCVWSILRWQSFYILIIKFYFVLEQLASFLWCLITLSNCTRSQTCKNPIFNSVLYWVVTKQTSFKQVPKT